jgi:hypothetical protein
MPALSVRRHTPMLAAEHDVRAYAGQLLMTVDGNNIPLQNVIEEPHWDALALLHGYGSRAGATLSDVLTAEWQAQGNPGSLTVSIDAQTDRVQIQCSGCAIKILPLNGGDNEKFGIPSEGSIAQGFVNTVIAPNEWQRGVFELSGGLSIQGQGHSTVTVPAFVNRCRVQSLPIWLSARNSSSEPDDVWHNRTLDDVITATLAVGNPPIVNNMTMLVEPSGKVSIDYDAASAWSFNSGAAAFWQLLGFDGREVGVAHQGNAARRTMTSNNRCRTLLASDTSYVSLRRFTEHRDKALVMADGSLVTSGLEPMQGWDLTLRAHGPARGYSEDQERHLRHFLRYARRRFSFYPQWGDMDNPNIGSIETRRHVNYADTFGGTAAIYGAYSTAEADVAESHWSKRKGGKLQLRRHPRDNDKRGETYGGGILDAYQDLSFKLYDDSTR